MFQLFEITVFFSKGSLVSKLTRPAPQPYAEVKWKAGEGGPFGDWPEDERPGTGAEHAQSQMFQPSGVGMLPIERRLPQPTSSRRLISRGNPQYPQPRTWVPPGK